CNWTIIPPAYINFTQFTVGGNAMYIKQGESIVRYELVWTVNNQTNATNITSSNPDFSYTFTGRDGMRYKNIKCRVITDQREGIWSNPIESVLVDTTPPNASITKPEQEEVTLVAGKFLVAWSGTDSGSGIDKYDVQKSDDGVAWDYWKTGTNLTQDNFTASAGQTWHFRVRAIDKAGNVGNWSTEKIVSVIGEVQVNWSFIPSTGIIKTGENITIKAAIYSDTDILNVTESYEGNVTNITKNITQISGKRWNVSWVLIEPESGKNQTFRITIKDVNNHSIKRETKFSVVVCMPNENKTCCRGVNGTVCQSSTYQNTICTFGTSVCTSSYEWGSCSGIGPSIEICDSKDNDCDGEIDEGINCQCTPNTTRFICPWGHCNTTGLAEGTYNFESWCLAQEQRCNASGLWGTPTGGRGPRQETCNGIDDDCDGETDDGNPQCCTPEGAERMYGLQNQSLDGIGICKIGIDKCQNGQWVTIQTPQAPTSEICDNSADDDCDGKTDVQDEDCQGWGFEFPWWIFVGLGVGVLVALIVLWIWFRKKGTDLTWENLIKKWTPTE
ncbi:MAG: MopE-related protein, partial [Candidatus Aenigmatarchaeota archaeon]